MITYVIKQDFEGKVWTSEPFKGDRKHATQNVVGGFLMGSRRWAVDTATNALIFGLDGRGKAMTEASTP